MKASEERKLKRNALVREAIEKRREEILAQKNGEEAVSTDKDDKPKRKRKAS